MGRSTTPMHFPARGYPRTPPFEKLERMRSFNGDINQRQWTASQFKQMPSRLTLSSLRRAEGRIANWLNSATLQRFRLPRTYLPPSCGMSYFGPHNVLSAIYPLTL